MEINKLMEVLEEHLQVTYFELNPYNPNNTEDNYQELLRENLNITFKSRIESEETVQKKTKNILGEGISLKNKTERYDLLMELFDVIFELKAVEKLEKPHENQLFNYLDNSKYKYGILVNFTKTKNMKNTFVHCKVFEKVKMIKHFDKFKRSYTNYRYKCIEEFKTQSYYELFSEYVIDENVIEIG